MVIPDLQVPDPGCVQYDEWGNPQKPEFYEYMKSYSPVDNIQRTAYPNILVTAGEAPANPCLAQMRLMFFFAEYLVR